MSEILQGDVNDGRFDKAEQYKTVFAVENEEPGKGIDGEAENVQRYENRYFAKMRKMQAERDAVDGKAERDRDRKELM